VRQRRPSGTNGRPSQFLTPELHRGSLETVQSKLSETPPGASPSGRRSLQRCHHCNSTDGISSSSHFRRLLTSWVRQVEHHLGNWQDASDWQTHVWPCLVGGGRRCEAGTLAGGRSLGLPPATCPLPPHRGLPSSPSQVSSSTPRPSAMRLM
jgi:hypothetical protein